MAGLLTARVLADAFEDVILIDKDALPEAASPRAGVPQGRHFNGLLEAARISLEDLFPGYGEDLCTAGGLVIDMSRDAEVYQEGGFLAHGPYRIPMYSATRPLVELVTRRRVAAIDAVRLRPNCQFTQYLVDDEESRVSGVVVRTESGAEEELTADLVVDATGWTSRTPTLLEYHGFTPPPVDEVVIDVAYSTTFIERPDEDRRMIFAVPSAPRTRGGVAVPVEDEQWLVTMMGVHGDHPRQRLTVSPTSRRVCPSRNSVVSSTNTSGVPRISTTIHSRPTSVVDTRT